MMYELVELMTIRFHTDDELYKVVQDMMQLQMTSFMEQDPQMYLIRPHILDPYPQPQVAYDSYGYEYGYRVSEISSSGYYPMQSRVSYGSEFAAGIFGWGPSQSDYQPDNASQSQDLSESSRMSYDPARLPYGINTDDYNAICLDRWTDVPPNYINDPAIYEHQ